MPVYESMAPEQGKQRAPARLHVFLAREAPVGLILRRSRARYTCAIGWDRERDGFTIGQWIEGRIYHHRSDLSPDGKHFLYYVLRHSPESGWCESFVVVSRSPYLSPVASWADGTGTRGSAGCFTSNTEYWLSYTWVDPPLTTHLLVEGLRAVPMPCFSWEPSDEIPLVYEVRLRHEGWDWMSIPLRATEWTSERSALCKQIGSGWCLFRLQGRHSLQKPSRAFQPPPDAEWHALFHEATGAFVPHTDWEWADVDRHRLVWASGGKLFEGFVEESGVTREREIADFNDMEFTELRAPYDDRPADDDEG